MASRDLQSVPTVAFDVDLGSLSVPRRVRRGLLGAAVFFLGWWLLAGTMPSYLLPTPVAVVQAFFTELTTPATLTALGVEVPVTELFLVLIQSLMHYVPGLLMGVGLGAPLGLLLGYSTRLDEYVTPVVSLLRPIPPLAWMGFVIVWIGIGHAGAAFIVAIGSFWITLLSTYDGVAELPTEWVEVGESLGVERDLTMLRKVVVPGIAPSIFTGIRTSIGRSWMIVVAAELFGAPGIGYRIIHTAQSLSMDVSMAYMLALGLVYLASDFGFRHLRGVIEP
ncbi:ABC transporter permease subunit [Halodesulfurarchaeum sp. HSR-GB]|uniref:ABC transporter permease n=1 Tax=Halodesulfurarchaeum sp. HSR-GB TaxID=3074077 RepID=UPI00285ACFFB|nr:ABC transporter permease subunit [Halodesulfurarchaeum sp. HSR-GB]MDR5657327.1 ABC transporter permease subunit [Halodesulfurarchaeum sp. HSR-GB]